jgi:type II secretory pathway pseudopilin PulG
MIRRALSVFLLPRRRQLREGIVLSPRNPEGWLETLAVIAIVGLLVAFAFDGYRFAVVKASMTEAANLMGTFKIDIATDLAVYGRLPDAVPSLEAHRQDGGKYFSGFTWQDDELVTSLRSKFATQIAAELQVPIDEQPLTISFRFAVTPEPSQRVILCGLATPPPGFTAAPVRHTTVPEAYLPSFCRI